MSVPQEHERPLASLKTWILSGVTLVVSVASATWTYTAWMTRSPLLDLPRLQLFVQQHPDVWQTLGLFALGILCILLAHELGHLIVAPGLAGTPPIWLPAPGLYLPCFGGIRVTSSPLALRYPAWQALLGPTFGIIMSLMCITLNPDILERSPYVLTLDVTASPLALQYLFASETTLTLTSLQTAGWMGLLLSSFQLLPIGATDGGQFLSSAAPQYHSAVSWIFFAAFTLFTFSLPFTEAVTWWGWVFFSALHLFGSPLRQGTRPFGALQRIGLVTFWLTALAVITSVSSTQVPQPVIPEMEVSREVEL